MDKNKVVIRRKHTNTTFEVSNNQLLMDVFADPYSSNPKMLVLIRLTDVDVRRLRDLCDTLLEEVA